MNENKKCLKSSHSANFWGGGNSLRLRNEDLENGTAKPCHPEERSDVGIASSSNIDLTPHLSYGHPLPQGARNKQQKQLNVNHLLTYLPTNLLTSKKVAFTLAEVLITLGIIGVVAAMTLPTLNQAINNKVRAEQVRTVKYKFTKATEKMNSLGLIGPYNSTDAFVDELQKHLKIMKRCDSSHLRECWPYDEVDLGDGKTWDISKTKTGKNLKMEDSDSTDYSSNNVGIVTADGTPMILSYNKKCEALDPVKQYTWSTSDGKPETNLTAGCVAAVFEINGGAKPNKYGDDVQSFNAGGLGSSCAIEIGSLCLTAPFSPEPLTFAECEAQKDDLGIKGCYWAEDYWAGAVKACKDQGKKLPTTSDLDEIAKALYQNKTINSNGGTGVTYISGTATSLGFSEPPFFLWSDKEYDSGRAYYRLFHTNLTFSRDYERWLPDYKAVCVGE